VGHDKGKILAQVIGTTLVVAAAALTIALRTVVDILKIIVDAIVGVIKVVADIIEWTIKMGKDIKKVFDDVGQFVDDVIHHRWIKALGIWARAILVISSRLRTDTFDSIKKIFGDFGGYDWRDHPRRHHCNPPSIPATL
jgi:hypothetical protein